jgi:hypothetical protein
MTTEIECERCGAPMRPGKYVSSDRGLQAMGCLVMLFGLAIAILWFPVGTLIGIALIIGSVGMTYRIRTVWQCESCGHFLDSRSRSAP